jgi:hypothetical protein
VAVTAFPSGQNVSGSSQSRTDGLYLMTTRGLYKLNSQDQLLKVVTDGTTGTLEEVKVVVDKFSLRGGDNGDGSLDALNSIAVDNYGNLYATDKFSRLQKFQLK